VRGLALRKTLVVLQFGISIVLITGTLVAYDQLDHLLNADIGFDKEQVVMLPVTRSPLAPNYETFKDELLKDERIAGVTALEEILGAKHQTGNYQWEGMAESRLFPRLFVRHDFLETFAVDLAAGRSYDETRPTDEYQALVINEAMARTMGWKLEDALGKTYYWGNGEPGGKVVGVVQDFHFTSLRQPINPLVLDLRTDTEAFNLFIKYVAVRIRPGDVQGALDHVQATWEAFVPTRGFDYFFLDDHLDQLYRTEQRLGSLAGAFALLAIFVACLGLFGLAAFTATQRTKEIGVRKVLGASVPRIVVLLSKDFVRLVLVAFVVAAPVAYLLMNRWLEDFASRVTIEWPVFIIAGVLTLAIALGTVSYQAVKAATVNPVRTLRAE
jgi:putative ABC transport system permease protein